MSYKSRDDLLAGEESHKEKVYSVFDDMQDAARQSVAKKEADVRGGAYEEHSAFMVYGELAGANKSLRETDRLITKLYKKPYFAHIEVVEDGYTTTEHFYLSDCETLDAFVPIGTDGALLPFKQDNKRPISAALFHCYQSKKGEPVSYTGPGGRYTLIPELICDDEISNRSLIDAVQLYPENGLTQINADELLEERLEENRNNPTLKNIIATLQKKQFEIIEANTNTSFVVQGCAGSGKSQCLLHRLFFLRDELSQDGWNHILLITPTQLFRHYSAELIRRYQLSGIENSSVAELYSSLLNAYDSRFKYRQYRFELSEEYLPDGYLKEIYDSEQIASIDNEIIKAIRSYVQNGCRALGISIPTVITAVKINEIVRQLEAAIQEYDLRESILQQDAEYSQKRKHYEQLIKRIDNLQKRRDKLIAEHEQLLKEKAFIDQLQQSVMEAESEREEWLRQRETEKSDAIRKLNEEVALWNSSNDIRLPAKYAHRFYIAQDLLNGNRFNSDEEYLQFLNEYCEQANKELQGALSKLQSGKELNNSNNTLLSKAGELLREIEALSAEADEYAIWIRNQAETADGEKSKITLRRSEMERARYFLSRIESTVFEQEVWNELTPLKEKYQIQTLQIDTLADGHQRETRILYKSDLLFYIKIYKMLYPNKSLPDYHLICVDEGQDLHQADYEMLRNLYPNAVFNVFGDTDQVLHTACGISDWIAETGITKLYSLNRNYRNTAAIVEFCNQSFGSSMEYIGVVKKRQQPIIVNDIVEIEQILQANDIVLIVRDYKMLQQLSVKMGKSLSSFEYLDTKSAKETGGKITCYSIFAAKGLEFSNVVVYAKGMTKNQQVVACTRAMEVLYYYD